MTTFACACLIVILVAIQHILNWLLRPLLKHPPEEDLIISHLIATGFLLFASWICLYYLVKWMYPLIS